MAERRSTKKSAGKSKKKPSGNNTTWILGGVAAAVVAAGAIGAFMMMTSRGKPKAVEQPGAVANNPVPTAPTPNVSSPTAAPTTSTPIESPVGNSAPAVAQAAPIPPTAPLAFPEFTPEMKSLQQRGFSFPPRLPGGKPFVNAEIDEVQGVGPINFSDEDFDGLYEHFPNLLILKMPQSKITDAGSVKLAQFAKLRVLDLKFTAVSDKTVEAVTKGIQGLVDLDLSATKITDKSLKSIATNCADLERLVISGTSTGDVGLFSLTKTPMEKLKYFSMEKAHQSKNGWDAFVKAHPNCKYP